MMMLAVAAFGDVLRREIALLLIFGHFDILKKLLKRVERCGEEEKWMQFYAIGTNKLLCLAPAEAR